MSVIPVMQRQPCVSTTTPKNPVVGDISVDTNIGCVLIFNGGNWQIVVDKESTTKVTEEMLCAKHPGLAELKKELDAAKEKYEAFKALVEE